MPQVDKLVELADRLAAGWMKNTDSRNIGALRIRHTPIDRYANDGLSRGVGISTGPIDTDVVYRVSDDQGDSIPRAVRVMQQIRAPYLGVRQVFDFSSEDPSKRTLTTITHEVFQGSDHNLNPLFEYQYRLAPYTDPEARWMRELAQAPGDALHFATQYSPDELTGIMFYDRFGRSFYSPTVRDGQTFLEYALWPGALAKVEEISRQEQPEAYKRWVDRNNTRMLEGLIPMQGATVKVRRGDINTRIDPESLAENIIKKSRIEVVLSVLETPR